MRRITRVPGILGVIAAIALAALAHAPAVAAFELNGGCTLDLASTDASGAALDTAANGRGGTQEDPFIVDWDGTVSWNGSSGDTVFKNHSWQVYVFNIPTPLRGGDDNDEGTTTSSGSTGVSANAPFQFTGLYFVSGNITGDGGARCDGSAWLKLNGNPLTTIPFWIAIVLVLIGLLLVMSSRGSQVTHPAAPASSEARS